MNYSQTRRCGENQSQVFWSRVEPTQRRAFQFVKQNEVLVHRLHREYKPEELWQRASGADSELRPVGQQRCPDISGNGSFFRRVDHRFGIGQNTLRI